MIDKSKCAELVSLREKVLRHVCSYYDTLSEASVGNAVDIIKDLAEAEYYCTVVEAMEQGEDRMGYTPTIYRKPDIRWDMEPEYPRESETMHRESNSRYGKAYNDYKEAKKYYTETKSPEMKDTMEQHAREHLMDTIASIKEMYDSSDTVLKERIKKDLDILVKEL